MRPEDTAALGNVRRNCPGGLGAKKPPRWSAERRASPGARTAKADRAGTRGPRYWPAHNGCRRTRRLSALRFPHSYEGKRQTSEDMPRENDDACAVVCNPHEAQRNAGPTSVTEGNRPGFRFAPSGLLAQFTSARSAPTTPVSARRRGARARRESEKWWWPSSTVKLHRQIPRACRARKAFRLPLKLGHSPPPTASRSGF